MNTIRFVPAAAPLLAAGSVAAHPGHGAESHAMGFIEGLLHMLTQPDHLGLLAAAVVAAVVVARRLRAARRDRSRDADPRR